MNLAIPEKIISSASRVALYVAGGVMAVMMAFTAIDVILRYIFNSPIRGHQELVEIMLVLVVFFGVAYTAIQKGHVRVDIIISRLPQKIQVVLECIFSLIAFCFFALITWQSVLAAIDDMQKNLTTTILYVPIFPFVLALAAGALLLCLVLLVDFSHSIARIKSMQWKLWQGLVPVLAIAVLAATAPLWLQFFPSPREAPNVGYIGMGLVFFFMFFGMPIGFAMGLFGFLGMFYLVGANGGLTLLGSVPYSTSSTYDFTVLPLFLLMGAFAFHSGMSEDLYRSAHKLLRHLPGGLAMATVSACAGFAAVCGSSLATGATMGMVALPEMRKYKYDPGLATGCVAAGGTIGILIPPSVVFVLYGILTGQPIGALFTAGFLPGILQTLLFIIAIYIVCKLNPRAGGQPYPRASLKEMLFSLKDTWGVLLLFLLVIGGLYIGIFTPTEGAGVGAFGAFLFALTRKKLTWRTFANGLVDSTKTTAMAFTILIGATILTYFLAVTRLPNNLSNLIASSALHPYVVLLFITIFYYILGCLMDAMSMILLTIPVIYPLVLSLGFDPIWFGVYIVIMAEIGMITPPVGMNVFVIAAVAKDVPMYAIFRGIVPFLIADTVLLVLLIAVPQIALLLPSFIK